MNKKRFQFMFGFFFLITLISLANPILGYEEITEKSPISVTMIEFSSNKGEMSDVSSIDLALPQWNLTTLDMNITNFHSETNEVKNYVNDSVNMVKFSSKENEIKALAVQLEIREFTTLSSIFIYGKAVGSELEPIFLQIEGYDSNTNCPNSILYGDSIEVNMSENGWYDQKFPDPLELSKGLYFIVLNARSIEEDTKNYFWSYSDTPKLYSSYYTDESGWISRGNSSPFSYKLNYFCDTIILPEEINANIELDGNLYQINNSGIVQQLELNKEVSSEFFHINVIHNSTYALKFDIEYDSNSSNILQASGTVEFNRYKPQKWSIKPSFSRCGYDYQIFFQMPKNWYDINVFKNKIDISDNVLIKDHLLYLSNSSINKNDIWEIQAYSPSSYCEIEYSEDEWKIGTLIDFWFSAPSISGDVTLKLVDKTQYIHYKETKPVLEITTHFSYTIDPDLSSGVYETIFLWQNGTDATFQSYSFYLDVEEKPMSIPFIEIAVIIGIISLIAGISIYVITKMKSNFSFNTKNESRIYEDLFHLKYIIVSHKKSGLNIYEHFITGDRNNSSLVSSYLSAIHDLGIEIFEIDEEIPIIKIEFDDYFLFLANTQNSRTTFAMMRTPGEEFLMTMKEISKAIEVIYGEQINRFNGDLREFRNIRNIIENYFPLSILHPLKLRTLKCSNLEIQELKIIKKAKKLLSLHQTRYINAYSLLSKPIKREEFDQVVKLIQKRIFIPNNKKK